MDNNQKLKEFIDSLPKDPELETITTIIPTDGTKWRDSKQALMFMLKGYTQNDIDAYQDWLDNKESWEFDCDFEDYIADLEWENSEEFQQFIDQQMEKD